MDKESVENPKKIFASPATLVLWDRVFFKDKPYPVERSWSQNFQGPKQSTSTASME